MRLTLNEFQKQDISVNVLIAKRPRENLIDFVIRTLRNSKNRKKLKEEESLQDKFFSLYNNLLLYESKEKQKRNGQQPQKIKLIEDKIIDYIFEFK